MKSLKILPFFFQDLMSVPDVSVQKIQKFPRLLQKDIECVDFSTEKQELLNIKNTKKIQ